jgi:2-hydroxy-5-methyl-1-naphthoate 7-hydroxylase
VSSLAPENSDEISAVVLDPYATDHHAEAARLRELGPATRVILPGGIPAWAVSHYEDLAGLVSDPRVSKDWRNWNAIKNGQIPDGWPLDGMVRVTNMVTADGAEHHRLRRLVTKTLTQRRVQELRPRITEITSVLLDELPAHAGDDGVVDLRPHYAYPVPMQVICEFTGVPEQWRPRLRELVDSIFRTDTTAEEVIQTQHDRVRMLEQLVELRRAEPGNDLTSALIAAQEEDPDALTPEELIDTLWLLLTAGHETTLSLIVNATRALLTHPEQRELTVSGGRWEDAIEETLRWDAPIGNFMARYPLEDIEIGGVIIPAGDAILACFTAAGRDTAQYGPGAGSFHITGATSKHLAFSGGPHFCLGASLARVEGAVALRSLFTRYPQLQLADPGDTLPAVPSLFSNSARTLPVRLGTPA